MPSDSDSSSTIQQDTLHLSAGTEPHVKSEFAHVLFLDIVGFTKLRPAKQHHVLGALQAIVSSAEEFCNVTNNNELIALPTGDGMALVFFNKEDSSGPAISCAEQITLAINDHNKSMPPDVQLCVRMGLHSGNVIRIDDINQRPNVAGDGINTAQRVMDCGDIGHILLSDYAFRVLPAEPDRTGQCKPLGEVKVKHDQVLQLYNLCSEAIGNEQVPKRVHTQHKEKETAEKQKEFIREAVTEIEKTRKRRSQLWIGLVVFVALTTIVGSVIAERLWRKPPPLPTLAVLPFQPLSPDKRSSKAISDGLTEQFYRIFANPTSLTPQSTVESMIKKIKEANKSETKKPISPAEVAQQLGVRYVLSGTAESRSSRDDLSTTTDINIDFPVDVHVELYDAEQGKPLWQADYQATPFRNLITLPVTITEQVMSKMGAPVNDTKQYVKNAKAYWYYLRGRYSWIDRVNHEGNRTEVEEVTNNAIKSYEDAIALDPQYASGLADLYISIGGLNMSPAEAKDKILSNAARAMNNDSKLAEPYASIGMEKCWFERDFLMAKLAFLRALELNPKYSNSYRWYSSCLTFFKQRDEADQQIEEARKLEPESFIVQISIGQNYYFSNRNSMAIEQLGGIMKQLEGSPKKPAVIYRFLAMAYEQDGKDDDKALELLDRAKREHQAYDDSDILGAEGHIYAHEKLYLKALEIAHNLEQLKGRQIYVSPYNIALIYSQIPGQETAAFKWLDQAISEYDPRVTWLKVDPRFAQLRQDRKTEFDDRLRLARLPVD